MNKINTEYTQQAADWRKLLKKNTVKTYLVIFVFFLIYLVVGFLSDLLILLDTYPQESALNLSYLLLTLQVIPYATIITMIVALLSLMVTFLFHKKLILLGTKYREIDQKTASTFQEKQLVNLLEEMKIAAGLNYLPKLYIIEADYMNAGEDYTQLEGGDNYVSATYQPLQ